jgi:nickel-type superoxide dismutase maturation protease
MGDDVTLPSHSARQSRRSAGAVLVRGLVAAAGSSVVLCGLLRRVEVAGDSMRPLLSPGDRLLVLRHPRWRWRVGQLAALRDPREAGDPALLVKRVSALTPGGVEVLGDNPSASTDSRTFGPVDRAGLVGPVLYRYWPPERAGRLR